MADEKRSVLHECHDHPGTGNHGGLRATRDKVVAGYYWSPLKKDVYDWVRCCHRCQLNDPISTQTPTLHPIKDERTNQNVKRALRRYVNESHDHWDIHLPAVVYGINTTSQASTKYTPFFLMFHRHPRFPEVMNACPIGDSWEVADPEEDMDTTVDKIRLLNEKVLQNI
ncbi:uncharacterized protein ACB058_010654 [Synchiropus picturatus]